MKRLLVGWLKFGLAALLARLGVFRRFPGLAWRGRVRHPLLRFRSFNHSRGELTSHTDRVGRVSRNSRSGRTRVDLPGPLSWTSRRRQR